MNDNHSQKESFYTPRWITPRLREATADHPVVILTGARQVGKSTLLQEERPFSQWHYASLDDFDVLQQVEWDPTVLWSGRDHLVLDEVQKSPALLSAIKQTVDQKKRKIRFILSGSANLLLMQKVSESLAGRAVHFPLFPMTLGEIRKQPPQDLLAKLFRGEFPVEQKIEEIKEVPTDWMLRGFMPPLLTLSSTQAILRWWEGYVATYLERDLRQLSSVESLPDFRRVMETIALRSGQMLNQTEVSRDTGVSQPTIHRYLNLLEASWLLIRLPAFAKNRTKRLIKTPKVYWIDPGLASYLAGYHDVKSLKQSKKAGGIFETLVLLHLHALSHLMLPRPRLFYWRTTTGKEVDFVIEWGKKMIAVEVKLTTTPRYGDTDGLRLFMDEYPGTSAGILIHAGRELLQLHEKIISIPWQMLG